MHCIEMYIYIYEGERGMYRSLRCSKPRCSRFTCSLRCERSRAFHSCGSSAMSKGSRLKRSVPENSTGSSINSPLGSY